MQNHRATSRYPGVIRPQTALASIGLHTLFSDLHGPSNAAVVRDQIGVDAENLGDGQHRLFRHRGEAVAVSDKGAGPRGGVRDQVQARLEALVEAVRGPAAAPGVAARPDPDERGIAACEQRLAEVRRGGDSAAGSRFSPDHACQGP